MKDEYTIGDVVERLDKLINIMKLAYKTLLDDIKMKLKQKDVYKAILEITAKDEISYANLIEEVMRKTNYKERSIQSSISELADMKILKKRRDGQIVYYSYTDILE